MNVNLVKSAVVVFRETFAAVLHLVDRKNGQVTQPLSWRETGEAEEEWFPQCSRIND